MQPNWQDGTPIYLQIRDDVVRRILDGDLKEREALPSVRQVASAWQLNPLTISKAYQLLVEAKLVEKKRGKGMFVIPGAQEQLYKEERQRFLTQEWPVIVEQIKRLGLDTNELLATVKED